MSPHCPELVDPERLARQESSCAGSASVDRFERLAPLLASQAEQIDFDFRFSRDTRYRPLIQGTVAGQLHLQCQRCLETMLLPVNSSVSLVVVEGLDEAASLAPEFDPLMIEAGHVNLLQIVEDELLLAVPVVPRHADCKPATTASGGKLKTQVVQENPFDALAQLKKSND